MPTSLRGIANRAHRDKRARFRNLYRLLNEDNLRRCFYQLRKDAAAGVDGVTFREYERELDANLSNLVKQLKAKKYRAKLVRRKYIPKDNGKRRPLGIPALEDKLLQLAVSQILSAIYEQDFLECSWGYRPKRGPRSASQQLAADLYRGLYGWVVEVDIRSFFDSIDHAWMLRMLQERIEDRAFLLLISKWLKAGIMEEDGQVVHSATGTPQGGIVSPILANVYLHYVLDVWFRAVVQKRIDGESHMMRYADDFVCAFRYLRDAKRFMAVLPKRLAKFSLEVAPQKTRLLQFCRFKEEPNEAFEFLGFEFRWVRRRTGHMGVQRRTAPTKMRGAIRTFKTWIRNNRHLDIRVLMRLVCRKLRGYWNYYGVRGNMASLSRLYNEFRRLLFKWLNRRSQRRSLTWERFSKLLARHGLPPPRIVEKPYSRQLSLT